MFRDLDLFQAFCLQRLAFAFIVFFYLVLTKVQKSSIESPRQGTAYFDQLQPYDMAFEQSVGKRVERGKSIFFFVCLILIVNRLTP